MKLLKNTALVLAALVCAASFATGCSDGNKENIVDNKSDKVVENENKKDAAEENVEEEIANPLSFNNAYLSKAVAECLGKDAADITEDDILSVRYLAIGPEDDGRVTVFVGLKDYVDKALSEDVTIEDLKEFVKQADLENTENVAEDLGRFKNVEMFEYYKVELSDVSFLNNYGQLIFGYFDTNGITDVSPLSEYNPETLAELDFTGNNIQDWSPVYHIKDKVIVNYKLEKMTDEEGNSVDVPMITMLGDIYVDENEEASETEGVPEAVPQVKEEATVTDTPVNEEAETAPAEDEAPSLPEVEYSDIDWSVLFGD